MAALLSDPLVGDVENPVSAADGGEPVGYHEGRLVLQDHAQGLLYQGFGFRVDGAGGLVQDDHGRVFQDDSGKGQKMSFPCGKP